MTGKKATEIDQKTKTVAVDLSSSYAIENASTETDIQQIHYSNLATVNVSHRDVFIDFLQMPGIKHEGTMRLPGARVFMSYASAQKLAEALSMVLEKAHTDGGMEEYRPDNKTNRE